MHTVARKDALQVEGTRRTDRRTGAAPYADVTLLPKGRLDLALRPPVSKPNSAEAYYLLAGPHAHAAEETVLVLLLERRLNYAVLTGHALKDGQQKAPGEEEGDHSLPNLLYLRRFGPDHHAVLGRRYT